jgi:hypothetical protein
MKVIAAVIGLLALSSAAHADDCKAIQDAALRLTCFDKNSVPKARAKKVTIDVDEFAAAKAVVERKLKDPLSAQWTNLFKTKTKEGEFICGAINSKNSYGGYVGARGFIFDSRFNTATIMFSGDSDPEYSGEDAARYCLYCLPDARSEKSIGEHCPGLIRAYAR